jgi:hypothetical protein
LVLPLLCRKQIEDQKFVAAKTRQQWLQQKTKNSRLNSKVPAQGTGAALRAYSPTHPVLLKNTRPKNSKNSQRF